MKNTLLTLLLLAFVSFSYSQDQFDFTYTIQSEAFQKERKVYVHVPERYYEKKDDNFGVIYVLDGQGREYYNNAKAIIDYLVWSYQIMPVIVVGIHSDNRNSEFIPKNRTLPEDNPDNFGQAHLLTQHIREEIFPMIRDSFRINKFKALIGHSRGGAFVANTIFSADKDMFNAYLAISPGMHYVNRQILNDAKTMIKSETEFHKFYFCTHGTVGSLEKFFKPQVELLDSMFNAYPNPTIIWRKKVFEGTSHWTVVAPSLSYGLLEMNRAFTVDQYLIEKFAKQTGKTISGQIEAYSQQQQNKLGYFIPANAGDLRYYANQLSEDGNYKKAIELFDLSLEKDPDNLRTYMNKAWACRSLDDNTSAADIYKKVLKILEANKMGWEEKEINKWQKNVQTELDGLN